jgi:hypothetical protein
MQDLHHNWKETLFAYSQVGYFDETWGYDESIKRSSKAHVKKGEWYKSCKHK